MSSMNAPELTPDYTPYYFLGGDTTFEEKPESALDWISIVRKGFSVHAIENALAILNVPRAALADALGMSGRTLSRRLKAGTTLTADDSAKMLRLARIFSQAVEVFEDADSANAWLKAPNPSLDNAVPLTLLDTEVGGEMVADALGRIEHGIFA